MIARKTPEELAKIGTELGTMIGEFTNYCLDFYGPDSDLYPMDMHRDEVIKALAVRMTTRKDLEFEGDTVDREIIRDIVLDMRAATRETT